MDNALDAIEWPGDEEFERYVEMLNRRCTLVLEASIEALMIWLKKTENYRDLARRGAATPDGGRRVEWGLIDRIADDGQGRRGEFAWCAGYSLTITPLPDCYPTKILIEGDCPSEDPGIILEYVALVQEAKELFKGEGDLPPTPRLPIVAVGGKSWRVPAPRVPSRRADLRKWCRVWAAVRDRTGMSYTDLAAQLATDGLGDNLPHYSADIVADIIRAGDAGLLDNSQ